MIAYRACSYNELIDLFRYKIISNENYIDKSFSFSKNINICKKFLDNK
jgi:hypothetical protein